MPTNLQALDSSRVSLEDAHHLARVHVPLSDLTVGRAGHDLTSLELAAPDRGQALVCVRVARQRLQAVSGLRVPHPDRAVVTAADQLVRVVVDTRDPPEGCVGVFESSSWRRRDVPAVPTERLRMVLAAVPVALEQVLPLDRLLPIKRAVVGPDRYCSPFEARGERPSACAAAHESRHTPTRPHRML